MRSAATAIAISVAVSLNGYHLVAGSGRTNPSPECIQANIIPAEAAQIQRWDLPRGQVIRARPPPAVPTSLGSVHFCRLQAFGTLGDFKHYFLALSQRAEAISIDCAVMNEHFLSVFHRDEAVALFRAKPLDNSTGHFPRQPPC